VKRNNQKDEDINDNLTCKCAEKGEARRYTTLGHENGMYHTHLIAEELGASHRETKGSIRRKNLVITGYGGEDGHGYTSRKN